MSTVYCFSVQAHATPGTLARIVEVFELHGHLPSRCHGERVGPDLEELVLDLQLEDLTADEAALIAKRLGRVVTVTSVLWSAKLQLAAA